MWTNLEWWYASQYTAHVFEKAQSMYADWSSVWPEGLRWKILCEHELDSVSVRSTYTSRHFMWFICKFTGDNQTNETQSGTILLCGRVRNLNDRNQKEREREEKNKRKIMNEKHSENIQIIIVCLLIKIYIGFHGLWSRVYGITIILWALMKMENLENRIKGGRSYTVHQVTQPVIKTKHRTHKQKNTFFFSITKLIFLQWFRSFYLNLV